MPAPTRTRSQGPWPSEPMALAAGRKAFVKFKQGMDPAGIDAVAIEPIVLARCVGFWPSSTNLWVNEPPVDIRCRWRQWERQRRVENPRGDTNRRLQSLRHHAIKLNTDDDGQQPHFARLPQTKTKQSALRLRNGLFALGVLFVITNLSAFPSLLS